MGEASYRASPEGTELGIAVEQGARVSLRPRLPRAAAFWVVGATLVIFLAAAGAPTPLYVVYQRALRFSAITLTTIFAVYALALLLTLLTVGALSDHVGRRPVLGVSLVVEAAGMLVFMRAHSVGGLLAARVLQGLATGAATGAISAYLIDLAPRNRPTLGPLVNTVGPAVGLTAGALLSALLVEYVASPEAVVFLILAIAFGVLVIVYAFMPETMARRPGAISSLRPRAGVPVEIRGAFLAVVPCLFATWASAGLYLALGPSLVTGVLGMHNYLLAGIAVATVTAAGAVTSVAVNTWPAQRAMLAGCAVLAIGTGVTVLALWLASTPVFFVGAALSGIGFGAAFLGAFRSVALLATPRDRAELFATVYIVSYLAFSVPAVLAGLAAMPLGLRTTATLYGGVVAVLAVAVLPLTRARLR
jgi:MFS family permease